MNLPELAEDYQPDFAKDRENATEWARQVLADPRCVVLDTETTGLGSQAEIIELAVLNAAGDVLFNSRFKPSGPIPRDAAALHGITDAAVADAPTFAAHWDALVALLHDKLIVTWGADFDQRLVYQTATRYGLKLWPMGPGQWACAMRQHAQWYGAWDDWHGSYRWQKLENASWVWAEGSPADHTALGDARACLAVVQQMAASAQATQEETQTDARE